MATQEDFQKDLSFLTKQNPGVPQEQLSQALLQKYGGTMPTAAPTAPVDAADALGTPSPGKGFVTSKGEPTITGGDIKPDWGAIGATAAAPLTGGMSLIPRVLAPVAAGAIGGALTPDSSALMGALQGLLPSVGEVGARAYQGLKGVIARAPTQAHIAGDALRVANDTAQGIQDSVKQAGGNTIPIAKAFPAGENKVSALAAFPGRIKDLLSSAFDSVEQQIGGQVSKMFLPKLAASAMIAENPGMTYFDALRAITKTPQLATFSPGQAFRGLRDAAWRARQMADRGGSPSLNGQNLWAQDKELHQELTDQLIAQGKPNLAQAFDLVSAGYRKGLQAFDLTSDWNKAGVFGPDTATRYPQMNTDLARQRTTQLMGDYPESEFKGLYSGAYQGAPKATYNYRQEWNPFRAVVPQRSLPGVPMGVATTLPKFGQVEFVGGQYPPYSASRDAAGRALVKTGRNMMVPLIPLFGTSTGVGQ